MHHHQDIYDKADLIARHLQDRLQPEEKEILQHWLEEDPENRILLERLQNKQELRQELFSMSSLNKDAAWKKISSKISRKRRPPFFTLWAVWKYAAAVLLVLSAGFLGYKHLNLKENESPETAERAERFKNDILPGGDKARLILADGSVVDLEEVENGTVSRQGGVKIIKKDGLLTYKIENSHNPTDKAAYNTISTPYGGQYRIVLPDGTAVWLNASSSLHYPLAFNGRERVVKLSGEAYFEVARNEKMPFKVLVPSNDPASPMEVKVLGTHFNIMTYGDEKTINTTLVEGSVQISSGGSSSMLVPGQQAELGRLDDKLRVKYANIDKAIAWKNGIFLFDSENIQDIMRQLSRWYDIEVDYRGTPPSSHFTGMVSRNNNVSKILTMLELTGGVQFTIEGKKITVYK